MRTGHAGLALVSALIVGCGTPALVQDAAREDAAYVDAGFDAAPAIDAAPTDVGVDAALDGLDANADGYVPGPPRDVARPLAPLSTATVSTRTPVLTWALPAGADGASVELCSDRDCARPIASFVADGTTGAPASPLPYGVVFWRVHARTAGVLGAPSVTWQMNLPHASAPVSNAWGASSDVNGDGLADVLMMGFAPDGLHSRIDVFAGSGGGLSGVLVTTLPSILTDQRSIAHTFGDLNGDGFVDAVVLAAVAFGRNEAALVYMGSSTGLRSVPEVTLRSARADVDALGAIAAPGDLDGDGYGDLVIETESTSASGVVGHLDVYLGGPDGPSPIPSRMIDIDAISDAQDGLELAGVGDVTGDGAPDVLVSGHDASPVYAGGPGGLASTPAFALPAPPTSVSYARDVSALGDVSGDGWPDVAVTGQSADGAHAGQNVYLGSASGLVLTPAVTIEGSVGLWTTFVGGGPGDLDGDGIGDLVFVSTSVDVGSSSVSTYLGAAGAPHASPIDPPTAPTDVPDWVFPGDVNGDARADFVLVSLDHVILWTGRTAHPFLLRFGLTPSLVPGTP